MKIRSLIVPAIFAFALSGMAQTPWMHFYLKKYVTPVDSGMPSMPVDSVKGFNFTEKDGRFIHAKFKAMNRDYSISLSNVDHWVIGPNVPTFRIVTEPDTFKEVDSKEEYIPATLSIDGAGIIPDFSGEMLVRGRGNYTWYNVPKKSYRIKFAEKTKIWEHKKAKNYVLLGNFIDPTYMRNHAVYSATQLIGAPYVNHTQPVDVYFNGKLKGSYMLSEKCGFNNGSVDLKKEDEAKSVMFELDTNFDEDFRSVSTYFQLPINLKDPDAPEDPVEAKQWWSNWVADFEQMEEAVAMGKNMSDYIDYQSLAQYLFPFVLSCNQEICHPKSVYLYKTEGGKYKFGPAWDFDWAFGYKPTYRKTSGNKLTDAERQKMKDEALAIAKEMAGPNGDWAIFDYNGQTLMWVGYDMIYYMADGYFVPNWPDNVVSYAPSYENYLLNSGKNSNNANGTGNGGEFFLSIVMNNPEFMAEYKAVVDAFMAKLPEYWESFDAYAAALKPSATKDNILWKTSGSNPGNDEEFNDADNTFDGAVDVLRRWIEKRIQFITDEKNNYGLYDPETDFTPGWGKR